MEEMTMRERMLAVYNNKLPDKIPIGIYSRYLPRGTYERTFRNMGLGIIEYHPVVSFLAPPWHTYPGFVSEVKGADISVKYFWQDGDFVERIIYSSPVGTIHQDSKQAAGAGSKYVSKHYITSIEDYKTMQYLVENTVFRRNEKSLISKKIELGDDGVVLGRLERSPYQKLLIESAGIEQFLMDFYTDSDPVIELMQIMDKKMDEAFEMIVESSADVFWQPDNISSDITPPDMFKEYCLPFYQKRSKQIKQTGKPYIVHMDGHIKALMNYINSVDFDAIESLSLPCIGGDYTLTEAREAFPGKIILPNFPSNLCNNSDQEMENFLKGLLEEAGNEDPFMLQVSEDLAENEWSRVLSIICRFITSGVGGPDSDNTV